MYGLLPPYFYGGDTSLEVESAVEVIFEEIIRLNFLKAEDTYEAPLKLVVARARGLIFQVITLLFD